MINNDVLNAIKKVKQFVDSRGNEVASFEPPKEDSAIAKQKYQAHKEGYLEALSDVAKILNNYQAWYVNQGTMKMG